MVGGQYVDVIGGGEDPDALRLLHSLKTGRLIAASVGAALAMAGRTGAEEDARTAASPPSSACSFRSSTTSST